MGHLGTTELLLVLLVVTLLFGAKRLPGAARSLGQSLRIFKAETKGLHADGAAAAAAPAALEAPQLPTQAAASVAQPAEERS